MRKALIAVVVASALFAVGAFAAEFAFQAEDIASGQDDVQACADTVEVTFPPATWIEATDSHQVAHALFTFKNGTAAATGCSGVEAKLRLQIDDITTPAVDETDEEEVFAISSGGTVEWTGPFQVADIVGAAALIEDELLVPSG